MNKGQCKTNCFGYCVTKDGNKKCTALKVLECQNCKFFKTKSDYDKNVLPLKHKSGGGIN